MNTHSHAVSDRADTQPAQSREANLFLFDLKNEASEHGFRPDDSWTLELVSNEALTGLKKYHYPIVSLKLHPDLLLDVFHQVKFKLQQSLSKQESELTVNDMIRDDIKQMAAYPSRKMRD